MNTEQFTSLLRTVLQVAGSVAVGRGWVDAETSTAIAGAVVTLAATAWSLWAHRNDALVKAAEKVPGVTVKPAHANDL